VGTFKSTSQVLLPCEPHPFPIKPHPFSCHISAKPCLFQLELRALRVVLAGDYQPRQQRCSARHAARHSGANSGANSGRNGDGNNGGSSGANSGANSGGGGGAGGLGGDGLGAGEEEDAESGLQLAWLPGATPSERPVSPSGDQRAAEASSDRPPPATRPQPGSGGGGSGGGGSWALSEIEAPGSFSESDFSAIPVKD